jgi:small GTP-binding protein
MNEKFNLIKVVLSGPTNSGKSSILERYIYNNFKEEYNYTVGVDFRYKLIKTSNIKFHFWDTCGLKHFKDLIKLYYNDTNVAIYTFDVNDSNSENECINYIKEYDMKPDVKLYLVGNKIDLLKDKFKLSDKLQKLCNKNNIKYLECSAKTGENIDIIFSEIISNFKLINNSLNVGTLNYIKSKC